MARTQDDGAPRERGDGREVVADEQHRASTARDLGHTVETALLEFRIALRQHLVDDQDFGLEMRGHGEGKPRIHADGVALDPAYR